MLPGLGEKIDRCPTLQIIPFARWGDTRTERPAFPDRALTDCQQVVRPHLRPFSHSNALDPPTVARPAEFCPTSSPSLDEKMQDVTN